VSAAAVAVNLLWCLPGQVGGSEQYLVRQLFGLATLDDGRFDPTLYVVDGFGEAHPDLVAAFTTAVAPVSGTSRPRRVLAESTWLRARARRAALVHHGGGTAPVGAQRPYLLTVHDLQYRTFPQYFSARKRRYLEAMMPRSVRHAALVAVPSEYVRGSIVAAFDVPPERVVVVPHGVEPAVTEQVTAADELRRRYALDDCTVLVYPAMTHPHKNHRWLLDLMRDHWRDPGLRLVLIGGVGSAEADVAACADPRVVRLGRVSDADRNGLMAMADALVFPSSYEGFGAPVIEAMTLGTPVVCSDVTCLPDIAGDAGLVLPLEPDAWAGALDEVARRRAELVAAGLERAQAFTSVESGRALARAYATALGRG
jgi:alpha-1,3-rhamnosyl/mannosyltransferase